MEEGSKEVTAFSTMFGLYQYERAPFGIRNCPSHFMRAMNTILDMEGCRGGSEEDKGGNPAFVDDLTTFGESFEKYLYWQRQIFEALRKKSWKLNPCKIRLGY